MKLTRRGSLRNSNLMGNPWTFGICLALGCAEDCTFQIAGAEMCSEMSSLGMWVLCQAPFRTRTLVRILWQIWQYHNGFCKNHLWIRWCGSLFPALVSLPSLKKIFFWLHRVLVSACVIFHFGMQALRCGTQVSLVVALRLSSYSMRA